MPCIMPGYPDEAPYHLVKQRRVMLERKGRFPKTLLIRDVSFLSNQKNSVIL